MEDPIRIPKKLTQLVTCLDEQSQWFAYLSINKVNRKNNIRMGSSSFRLPVLFTKQSYCWSSCDKNRICDEGKRNLSYGSVRDLLHCIVNFLHNLEWKLRRRRQQPRPMTTCDGPAHSHTHTHTYTKHSQIKRHQHKVSLKSTTSNDFYHCIVNLIVL